jgi:hypothetical protein
MSTVSLPGPLNTTINLRYGSTGLPAATVIDPAFPSGGYGGLLTTGDLTAGIREQQTNIAKLNGDLLRLNLDIEFAAQRVSSPDQIPGYIQLTRDQIASVRQSINSATNSLQSAIYLRSNLPQLVERLRVANATSPNTNTTSSTPAPNQSPTIIADTNAPVPATTPALGATGIRAIAPQLQAAASAAPQPAPVTAPPTAVPYRVVASETISPQERERLLASGEYRVDPNDPTKIFRVVGTEPPPVVDPSRSATPDNAVPQTGANAPSAQPPNTGITGERQTAAAQATEQDQANLDRKSKDWRVRLALAPGANYLYKAAADTNGQVGTDILYPLYLSDGVIFPYTPSITVQYSANYNPQDITHSNYKIYQYQNSSVDTVNITGTFTCQDVFEARYLLAVIHFFRSMTKMFYGQDDDPKNGTPPPLCYIYGMGGYQFDALPLAITGFTYNLPTDVDYIPTTGESLAGTPQPTLPNNNTNGSANFLSGAARLLGIGVGPGGTPRPPSYPSTPASINAETTWVPTRIELQINCAPVMSRNMVSNKFSLRDYASGNLLRGSKNLGGGMW